MESQKNRAELREVDSSDLGQGAETGVLFHEQVAASLPFQTVRYSTSSDIHNIACHWIFSITFLIWESVWVAAGDMLYCM
jgi:hypothetical protein